MRKVLSILFILGILITSCEETPKPRGTFTYSLERSFSPVKVSFVADYADASEYSWDFGDKATASGSEVDHEFITPGVHKVILSTTGEGGENIETQSIDIPGIATKMIIEQVDISRFPETNSSGEPWDKDNGPDIGIMLAEFSAQDYWLSSKRYENCENGTTYSFEANYSITDFDTYFLLGLLDYDEGVAGGENMGYVEFKTDSLRESGYPDSLAIDTDTRQYTIYVKWE